MIIRMVSGLAYTRSGFILYKGIPERALHGIVIFFRGLLFFRDPDTSPLT